MSNLDRYLFRGIEFSGEWVYGDLRRDGVDTLICEVGGPICHVVLHESIGQWTGLIDLAGGNIFEGDKVVDRMGRHFVVHFSNHFQEVRLYPIGNNSDFRDEDCESIFSWTYPKMSLTVTGNIHDHLLKKPCTAE